MNCWQSEELLLSVKSHLAAKICCKNEFCCSINTEFSTCQTLVVGLLGVGKERMGGRSIRVNKLSHANLFVIQKASYRGTTYSWSKKVARFELWS